MDSLQKVLAAVEAALEKKAYNLTVLEVEHLSSIADYFIIATGRSDVQVQAIARGIEERMDREAAHPISIEGLHRAHWVVLDYDDLVVHVFLEATREFYRLGTNLDRRSGNFSPRAITLTSTRPSAKSFRLILLLPHDASYYSLGHIVQQSTRHESSMIRSGKLATALKSGYLA